MKKYLFGLGVTVAAAMFSACSETHSTYSGPDYVMFADTFQVCTIQDGETY